MRKKYFIIPCIGVMLLLFGIFNLSNYRLEKKSEKDDSFPISTDIIEEDIEQKLTNERIMKIIDEELNSFIISNKTEKHPNFLKQLHDSFDYHIVNTEDGGDTYIVTCLITYKDIVSPLNDYLNDNGDMIISNETQIEEILLTLVEVANIETTNIKLKLLYKGGDYIIEDSSAILGYMYGNIFQIFNYLDGTKSN